MCLIPPEELQTVLINSPVSPLQDSEVQRLAALVDSGFRDWQSFHDRYASNQKLIREQPGGKARWSHLKSFLLRHGGAVSVPGITKTRFVSGEGVVRAVDEEADVLRLEDGVLRFVGDFDGGLFSGASVKPLGLNMPPVDALLGSCAMPKGRTGAAHIRWAETSRELREKIGNEAVFLVLVRQVFQSDSAGGYSESGTEMFAYAVAQNHTDKLSDQEFRALLNLLQTAPIRLRPAESAILQHAIGEEIRVLRELSRPTDEAIRSGIRYAVWPILAVHTTP
jgi:hypothetical protein